MAHKSSHFKKNLTLSKCICQNKKINYDTDYKSYDIENLTSDEFEKSTKVPYIVVLDIDWVKH